LPVLDRAFSALLQDLHNRRLLHEPLVVWLGDFGRTPKINLSADRGATNALGEFVIDSLGTPAEGATGEHSMSA